MTAQEQLTGGCRLVLLSPDQRVAACSETPNRLQSSEAQLHGWSEPLQDFRGCCSRAQLPSYLLLPQEVCPWTSVEA